MFYQMKWCILVHLMSWNAWGSPFCKWQDGDYTSCFDGLLEKQLDFVFGWMSTFLSHLDGFLHLCGMQPKEQKIGEIWPISLKSNWTLKEEPYDSVL